MGLYIIIYREAKLHKRKLHKKYHKPFDFTNKEWLDLALKSVPELVLDVLVFGFVSGSNCE